MLETYHFLTVRQKIAYWEFDFKAVCPTLDHYLLSQAHIPFFSPGVSQVGAGGYQHLQSKCVQSAAVCVCARVWACMQAPVSVMVLCFSICKFHFALFD